jgi:hypothetical protein
VADGNDDDGDDVDVIINPAIQSREFGNSSSCDQRTNFLRIHQDGNIIREAPIVGRDYPESTIFPRNSHKKVVAPSAMRDSSLTSTDCTNWNHRYCIVNMQRMSKMPPETMYQ